MRRVLYIFTILFLTHLTTNGQDKKSPVLNGMWGLINYGDTIFIDETEIKVGEWLDYVYYHNPYDYPNYVRCKKLSETEMEKIKAQKIESSLLPDIGVLKNISASYIFNGCKNCELITFSSVSSKAELPFDADSLKNKESKTRLVKYLNTPITGITYEQATKFCEWRTIVDSLRYGQPPKEKDYGYIYVSVGHGESFIFSLPTPEEFDRLNPNQDSIANKKGIIASYNYKNAKYSDSKKEIVKNKECGHQLNEWIFFSSINHTGWKPSTINMQGNASEMTSIKGIAKGGSYYQYATESKKGINNNYTKQEAWLGFRCVAKRKKNKNY